MTTEIIIATRNSKLAIWQADLVKTLLLEKNTNLNISLNKLTSEGDQKQDIALNEVGGKDLFVKNIQQVVLNNKAQIAVHSLKDMSAHDYEHLTLAAFLKRGDPRDAFVSVKFNSLNELPQGATVGTSSPRRTSLLKSFRPDLKTKLLRGNVQTRLQKLDKGEYDAIILAAAGLERLNLKSRITEYLNPKKFIPAIGQGIIVAECKSTDTQTQNRLNEIDDAKTRACATAERAFNQKLNGDCFTPLGAFAQINVDALTVVGFYGDLAGKSIIRAEISGAIENAQQLGFELAEKILKQSPPS